MGGQPANFLDVGGSSNPEKVLNALKLILKNKDIKVILINIFGGITRCDDIANGILAAKKQIDLPVPLVVRLTGTNEDIAKKIGRARSSVTETLSLRNIPESLRKKCIEQGILSKSLLLQIARQPLCGIAALAVSDSECP